MTTGAPVLRVLTLFPEYIQAGVRLGVVGHALDRGLFQVECVNPRDFSTDIHRTVDDRPYGGGDGMLMLAEPLDRALDFAKKSISNGAPWVVHLSPRGIPLTDEWVRAQSAALCNEERELILVSSRYAGVDERWIQARVDEEISIGDFVVSGGELPALLLIDALARHFPGVLGHERSAVDESFARGLLEAPQFTRPREWNGVSVPTELLSGHHAEIEKWRASLALAVTLIRRPDLLAKTLAREPSEWDSLHSFSRIWDSIEPETLRKCGLPAAEELRRRMQEMKRQVSVQNGTL